MIATGTACRGTQWTRAVLFATLGVLASAGPATAQCPDGTPPPCGRPAAVRAPARNSVAVLYLDNLSRDSADAYLVDGITEELMARLGEVPQLIVPARSYSQRLRGRPAHTPQELGRQLGAAYYLSGTFRRGNGRVRVTVELVRASSGRRVLTRIFDDPGADVLGMEEAIARQVVTAIVGELVPDARARLARRPTVDSLAYDLYLRARFLAAQSSETSVRQAIALYERALARDSSFVQGWIGLAWAWAWLADAFVPPMEAYPQTRRAAERALALDSTNAGARAVHALAITFIDMDAGAGWREAREALRLSPQPPEEVAAVVGGLGFTSAERATEALAIMDGGLARDPYSPVLHLHRAMLLYQLRRYDEAIAGYRRLRELYPQFLYIDAYDAASLRELGRTDSALVLYRAAEELAGGRPLFGYGIALARAGRPAEARAVLRALEVRAQDHYVPPTMLAGVRAALGDADGALRELGRAFEVHDGLVLGLDLWPWLDPLRSDPRFAAFRRRVNQP